MAEIKKPKLQKHKPARLRLRVEDERYDLVDLKEINVNLEAENRMLKRLVIELSLGKLEAEEDNILSPKWRRKAGLSE